jgi:hypothetical protein
MQNSDVDSGAAVMDTADVEEAIKELTKEVEYLRYAIEWARDTRKHLMKGTSLSKRRKK